MSGRVRVLLPDGRLVRGFRKTLRQNPRTVEHRRLGHKMPDWRLSFLLPDGYSLAEGFAADIIGLTIGRNRWVEVTGKRRDWVIGQAIRLIRSVAPHWRGPLLARLMRANGPGPTLSGPLRRGEARVIEIKLGDAPMVTQGYATRQLELTL